MTLVIFFGLWHTFNSRPAEKAAKSEQPIHEARQPATLATAGGENSQPTAPKSPKSLKSPSAGGSNADTAKPGAVKNSDVDRKTNETSAKEAARQPSATATKPPVAEKAKPPVAEKAKPSAPPDAFPHLTEAAARIAAKETYPSEIKKLAPPQVDVAARLTDPLRSIEFTDVPLKKAASLLASMSSALITLDIDALLALGVSPGDPVSLQLDSTTVGDVLQAILSERGLATVIDGGQILITAPAEYRETLRKVRYTVADLTGDDKAAVAELAALVRKFVAPESWQTDGGRGIVEPDRGALVVTQTGDVHRHVLVFCEKLRNARHKPLRSQGNPERFTLETRLAQAREMLDRPATANFHEPAPLSKILAFLGEASQSEILVDHASLAAAETSDQVEATLTADKQELGAALAALLRPLGLAYRVVDAGTIQVTTREAADERLELEFYPIRSWLDRGISGEKLAEALKARVAVSSWRNAGGLGDIHFDPSSGCLLVFQSQPVQSVIQRLLAVGVP